MVALSEEHEVEIAALWLAGGDQTKIGARFGISSSRVSTIIARLILKHRPDLGYWGGYRWQLQTKVGGRKEALRELLPKLQAEHNPDLGDLWIE